MKWNLGFRQKKTLESLQKMVFKIKQNYSLNGDPDLLGYNMMLNEELCKININLNTLLDRKNMSIQKLVDKIDHLFLREFTCAFLQSEGIWSKNLCGDGSSCNIKQTIKKIKRFLW